MGNRKAIQPRNIYRTEAEVILDTASSKNQPIKRWWGDSVGVNRAWRAYKVILAYLGGLLFSEKTVVVLQDFVNQGYGEGTAEVGLPHSSEEVGEWSEGGSKSAISKVTQEVTETWHMS